MKPLTILYLHYHDAPYRNPTLEILRKDPAFERFETAVMFPVDKGHSYWGLDYDEEGVISLGQQDNKGGRKWHSKIRDLLKKKRYDCVVGNGFYHYTSLYLLLNAWLRRIPIVFISDNVSSTNWGNLKRWTEHCKIRVLGKICRCFWVPGASASAYLETYGRISKDRIFHGAYTMETSDLLANYQQALAHRDAFRAELGISAKDRVYLMAANFIPNRQHGLLVEAFARLHEQDAHVQLVLLGEGDEQQEVRKRVESLGVSHAVHFIGGVSFDDLAHYYSACDFYVHSGVEPYSTAVMYGAVVGKPIVASKAIGAVDDVLVDGENGYIFEPECVDSACGALLKTNSLHSEQIIEMGERSKEVSSFYCPDWAARQLVAAIKAAVWKN